MFLNGSSKKTLKDYFVAEYAKYKITRRLRFIHIVKLVEKYFIVNLVRYFIEEENIVVKNVQTYQEEVKLQKEERHTQNIK